MTESAPGFAEVLEQMMAFIDGDVLIAHNAPFDMGVLKASADAISRPLPEMKYSCSLQISRKTYNLDSYRLNQVAFAIGHEEFDHHNALADSDACSRIVIHAANRHGVENLADLLVATKLSLKTL